MSTLNILGFSIFIEELCKNYKVFTLDLLWSSILVSIDNVASVYIEYFPEEKFPFSLRKHQNSIGEIPETFLNKEMTQKELVKTISKIYDIFVNIV